MATGQGRVGVDGSQSKTHWLASLMLVDLHLVDLHLDLH